MSSTVTPLIVVRSVSLQYLAQHIAKGWSEKQLRHCLHFSKTFPDEQIVSALRRQ
ncbi:hypothetical protein IQ249_15195 [Lusitaniella coriacea LEGE 07157]|uniref:Uncharacterized protein n=1 Tax=Lusitaniella coriacea LEGE 07157 TaxID=945747 RepID=A0A8J7DY51_9CYAN|nr:hypothetical protein [Lusitaniella coriacea]MBE9117245.1 hypothetical protein [Lusitaniella coriacea LEGE 07157]